MPRIARSIVDGQIYHVLNRGNGKKVVFHKKKDYAAFRELICRGKERYQVRILAYCVMPNHFHLVVWPAHGEALSHFMRWMMTSHVRRYHSHYGTSGHIWQGRFKSFLVQGDSHLLTVLRYVESNPVRASLASMAKDWPWSSHGEAVGAEPRLLIDNLPIARPAQWERYVNESWDEGKLQALRCSVNRQAPYGAATWREKVSKELGLQSTLQPRGRPKTQSN